LDSPRVIGSLENYPFTIEDFNSLTTASLPFPQHCEIMASAETVPASAPVADTTSAAPGIRKNGKQWHETKKAFRPVSGLTTFAKRMMKQSQADEVKKIEKEMKAEKEEERQVSLP
jgi:rRNA-processing protein CGR1